MKIFRGWALLGAGLSIGWMAQAAETGFSSSLTPAEFSATGLGKLSDEELSRLDALVRAFKSGPPNAERETAGIAIGPAADEPRSGRDKASASSEAAGPDGSSPRIQSSVRIAPGTRVEVTTIESRIDGDFRGWSAGTVFLLENGQRWRTTDSDTYYTRRMANPGVRIEPGMMGSFWMTIEGVKPRVRVSPIEVGK